MWSVVSANAMTARLARRAVTSVSRTSSWLSLAAFAPFDWWARDVAVHLECHYVVLREVTVHRILEVTKELLLQVVTHVANILWMSRLIGRPETPEFAAR